MRFRWHRGSLADSMETVEELSPFLPPLLAILVRSCPEATPDNVVVEPYFGRDERCDWDRTYIVKVNGGPVGFTDGPLLAEEEPLWRATLSGEVRKGDAVLEVTAIQNVRASTKDEAVSRASGVTAEMLPGFRRQRGTAYVLKRVT